MNEHGFYQRVMGCSTVVQGAKSAASKGSETVERISDYVRESYLYRWLTAEPETDVVTIDLRETNTVGPFIPLIDTCIDRVTPYWESSSLKRFVNAVLSGIDRLADTGVGRILVSILAPPEPPDDTKSSKSSASKDDENVDDD